MRETARTTYQMLEGFTELGCGKWGDENDCYPDLSLVDAWFEMTDSLAAPVGGLNPDEVAGLYDASIDVVRRIISATTMRLDDFDELIENTWVGDGEWQSENWQVAAEMCLERYVGDARNLEELSILCKYTLATELPRSIHLAPIWRSGMPSRAAPASVDDPSVFELLEWDAYDELVEGLAVASGVTGYIFEMERGFDPSLAGAYGVSDVEEWNGAFSFRNEALVEIVRIPRLLEVVAGPVRRWLLLERLVTATYERRLLDEGGFERFDEACRRYRSEVPVHIDALMNRYGAVPRLQGYELASARWRDAGRPDLAAKWDDEHRAIVGEG